MENDMEIGQKVIVRDGTPQPPAHHKRKLRAWHGRNFAGTLAEYQEHSPLYNGQPSATVEHDSHGLGSVCASFRSVIPANRVFPADEA